MEPNADLCGQLRRGMDRRLLGSLLHITEATETATGIELNKLRASANALSLQLEKSCARLNAGSYAAHWKLLSFARANNIEQLVKAFHRCEDRFKIRYKTEYGAFPDCGNGDPSLQWMYELLLEEHVEAYNLSLAIDKPSDRELALSELNCETVINHLARLDAETAGEISSLISEIRFLKCPNLNAGSSFPIYGCIYMHVIANDESWVNYLEHLVHETAHHLLFALWSEDPIVLNPIREVYASPLRNDPRPLSAIFHQMFVLARVIRCWSIFQQSGEFGLEIYKGYSNYQNDRDGNNFVDKFWLAERVVSERANLTELGREIAADCANMVEHSRVRFD